MWLHAAGQHILCTLPADTLVETRRSWEKTRQSLQKKLNLPVLGVVQWSQESFVPQSVWPSPSRAAALVHCPPHSGSVDQSSADHVHGCRAWGRQQAGQGGMLGRPNWALSISLAGGWWAGVGPPRFVLPPIWAMYPLDEVHSLGAYDSNREGADPWLAGGGQGYTYAAHLGRPAHSAQLSFFASFSPHFFCPSTTPLSCLPLRGRDGGVAWGKGGVASPRQGRVSPWLLVARVGQEGCLAQNVDFRWLQAVAGPDSCTVG